MPFLDLTIESTQGRDGFIDDPYVPGDQGYHSLPRRERVREVCTQSPAQGTPEQTGSAEHPEHPAVPANDGMASGKVTLTAQRIATGTGGGPDPPPDNKLCDHCLQATPRPCPRYDEHDTHECLCDHWSSAHEKEKHEQWKRQWESVFERKQRRLDEWENWLRNYFADLPETCQREELPREPVIPAVEQLPPFRLPSSVQRENVEAWCRRHAMPPADGRVPGEYSPERRPQWERPHAAYVDMPFRPTDAPEWRHQVEEQVCGSGLTLSRILMERSVRISLSGSARLRTLCDRLRIRPMTSIGLSIALPL